MGYDSYKLLSNYYNLIKTTTDKKITFTGVNWCPYVKLVEGDVYDKDHSELYFKDNGHYGFEPYQWTN
jgi:hypothetical protein